MRAFLLSLILLLFINFAFAQTIDKANRILEERGELYFSFTPNSGLSLDNISRIISIDKGSTDGRIFAYANAKSFSRFLNLGIPYQIEKESYLKISPQMATSVSDFMQNWDAYPTYYQYDSVMQKLAADYPNLCKYHVLDTLASGRKIMALQLGDSVNVQQKEPRFLYTSSMHGNELVGYVLMLRLANYLLSNYGQNARVDSLMNNVEIWINPLANPDGAYQLGDTTLSGATRYNSNFIDLNRNYPDPEDGQHPDGNSWQKETKIFMDFAAQKHFIMSANFHGGAEVLNYPWDTWSKLTADDEWWKYVCHQYADTAQALSPSNYFLGPSAANGTGVVNGYQWYTTMGCRQDYMNYYQACRELTIELSNNKMPQAIALNDLWNYNYPSLLNFINQSRFGLRGLILDSLTAKAIEGQVYINSHDKDSSQVFSHLPYGDYYRLLDSGYYSITFSAPHYYPKTIDSVLIIRNQAVNLNVLIVADPTSISQAEETSFKLYPNPAHDFIHINAKHRIEEISLYALDGKLLIDKKLNACKNYKLNTIGVEPGFYLIRLLYMNGDKEIQKLIIH